VLVDGRLAHPRSKFGRHIAEGRDAQLLRQALQLRGASDFLGEHSRQADVLGDHLAIAGRSHVPERQPDLERPKAA
jgi:hypothetical protein